MNVMAIHSILCNHDLSREMVSAIFRMRHGDNLPDHASYNVTFDITVFEGDAYERGCEIAAQVQHILTKIGAQT